MLFVLLILCVTGNQSVLGKEACDEGLKRLDDIPEFEGCHGVCEVAGDPHIKTFDCVRYEYHGQCEYTLAKNCGNDLFDFEIIGEFNRLVYRKQSVIMKLVIKTGGNTIEMDSSFGVSVNGKMMNSGYQELSVGTIQRYCNAVVVTLNNGLTIYWSAPYRATIQIQPEAAAALNGNICGLCGNNNGKKYDDFTTRENSKVSNVVEFGDSWRSDSECDACDDCDDTVCEVNVNTQQQAEDRCAIFIDGTIPACGADDQETLYPQCVDIMCVSLPEQEGLCDFVNQNLDECEANGTPVDVDLSGICEITEPGCLLDGKLILVGDSGLSEKCSACTCESDANLICQGECGVDEVCDVRNGIRGCYCKEGMFLAPNGDCQAMFSCRACGDPHYRTFDGKMYNFMGNCYYILAQSRPEAPGSFLVVADNKPSARHPGATITRYVYTFVDELGVQFSWDSSNVLVDDVIVNLPYTHGNHTIIYKSGTNTVLETVFGLRVSWDGSSCVWVGVPEMFLFHVEGLCGYLSRDRGDDWTNPGGQIETNGNRFGESWGLGKNCQAVPDSEHTCDANPDAAIIANRICSSLTDSKGPFAACIDVVDPTEYLDDCRYDACADPDDDSVSCRYLKLYADDCRAAGVIIDGWRDVISTCAINCGASKTYSDCCSACQPTCANPTAPDSCNKQCVQGCECNQGLLWSGDSCVSSDECGCFNDDGKYYLNGEKFINDECSSQCSCTSGKINCVSVACDVNAMCKIQNHVRGCYCNEFYEGNGLTCVVREGPCDFNNPCENSGVCVPADNEDGFICRCPEGWAGLKCTESKEPS
ncbi:zonadhesin-like [Amphiura filiformis]|uniref:zonadhesin-like n=1 Tax=Amphiura filiformis TaxID=82378 RepID=UPI003B2205F2